MIIKHKLKMEMTGKEPTPYIEVIQHEKKSRILELFLEENGLPISLPVTCKPVIRYKKPGRRYRAYDTLKNGDDAWYIHENTLGILLLPDVCDTDGNVELMMELVDENEILYTFPVEVRVRGNGFGRARVSDGGHFAGFLPQPENAKKGEYLYAAEIDHRGRVIRMGSKVMKATQGGAHIGPSEPQDEAVNLWVDTTEDAPEFPAGKDGAPGKSAYEYAKEGGYARSEEEFAEKLAEEYPQPDWHAAEGEPGHVLNRPFYKGLAELLNATIVYDPNGENFVEGDLTFTEGETYTVSYNGESYTCVAYSLAEAIGEPFLAIGSGHMFGLEDTGEPFFMIGVPGMVQIMDVTETIEEPTEITIRIVGERIVTIPQEYLPASQKTYIIEIPEEAIDSWPDTNTADTNLLYDPFIDILYGGGDVIVKTPPYTLYGETSDGCVSKVLCYTCAFAEGEGGVLELKAYGTKGGNTMQLNNYRFAGTKAPPQM